MKERIQGATLPGFTATVTDDTGAAISDGLSYAWTCQASATDNVQIWVKTAGITATASGFTVQWSVLDMGALTSADTKHGKWYVLEFTGTFGAGVIKHQESVKIMPEVV